LTHFLKAPGIDALNEKVARLSESEGEFLLDGAEIWSAKLLPVKINDVPRQALDFQRPIFSRNIIPEVAAVVRPAV
jgi:hypothetical protein